MSKIQKRNGVKKLTQKQHAQKRIMQKGRTMVEMLGVLAVIGVLTITGIVGMQYAMQVHKENETLNAFSVATAGARTANLMQNYIYSCDEIPCVVDPKQVISTKYEMTDKDFITAVNAPVRVRIEDTNGYTVRIRGISKELCESIKSGFWGETCAGIDRKGSDKRYRADNCTALKNLDCDQFANAKEGLSRRSALQEEIEKEHIQLSSYDAANNYSALVLYYGEPAGEDNTFVGSSGGYEEPDPDVTPDLGGEDNKPAQRVEEVLDKCTSQGGEWVGSICCAGSLNVFTAKEDGENCCNGYQPRSGADDGTCCQLSGYKWKKNSTCCNGSKDMNGNVVAACCDGYLVGNTCCIGSKNAETGRNDSACCEKGEMVNGVCCEGLTNTLTGEANDPQCCPGKMVGSICCENSKNWETGDTIQICCENSGNTWNNGVCCTGFRAIDSNQVDPACCKGDGLEVKNGFCCNGSKDAETGKVVRQCCSGEVKNGVCCIGSKDAETDQVVAACCDGNLIGETCCNGIYDQDGQKNSACCSDYSTPGSTNCRNNPDASFCCEANGGEASCNTETGELICCSQGTSTDLIGGGSSEECCGQAGGKWKGTWCCGSTAKGKAGSGGMCLKP